MCLSIAPRASGVSGNTFAERQFSNIIMDANALECGVCNELYDEGQFRPRILPCSHTHCSSCIQKLISSRRMSCPVCRKQFLAFSVNNLMINRSLIDVVRQFAGKGDSFEDSRGRGTSRAEWVDFPKEFCKRRLAECEKERAEILNFIKSSEMLKGEALNLSKEFDGSFIKILQDSKNESECITQKVGDKKKLLQSKLEALLKEEDNIKLLLQQQNLSNNSELLREVNTSVNKLLENIEGERLVADTEIRLMKQKFFQLQRRLSVIQWAMAEEGRDGDYITVENLRNMSSSLREIIEAGKLLAIQDHQGIRRYASVKLGSRNRICLFQLQELQHIPSDAFLIKHVEAMKLLDLSNCRTFLEIGVDETIKGRVVIKLTADGYYSNNFLHLCVGSMGPSYTNSKILEIKKRGMRGERARMGNYEKDATVGGKAVVKGVNWSQEMEKEMYKRTSCAAGLVKGLNGPDEESVSQFFIITKGDPSSAPYPCFGMVESGLDILRKAISQHPDVTRVTVVNSGVILSL